jgi:glycosyltransferase involved in cell wall biosynthesis
MAELPHVSVVVAVFNAQQTIRECIQSLLDLNYPKANLELIFVDNGSTDRTPEILSQYQQDIRILHEPKKGPAAARNKGILNAAADIIAFTDSDCVVDRDWLRHLIPPLENPLVGIVGGTILAKRPCSKIERYGEIIHDHSSSINEFTPPAVIAMNWISKLSVLKRVNLFDECFIRCEDVDLSYRILQSGYIFAFQPHALVYHRNESTYSGLFCEGFLHGLYAVQTIKKHRDYLSAVGHRRFNRASYTAIFASLLHALLAEDRAPGICSFVFNSGKKIGKIAGSLRFCHLDL